MVADLHMILKDLKDSLSFPGENGRLKPGALLENDAIMNDIRCLTDALENRQQKELPEPDAKTKFYIFLLAVNTLPRFEKPSNAQENHIQALARDLEITPETCHAVSEFFHTDRPYADIDSTVYIASKLSDHLIRSKGVNVYFTNPIHGEIIYLKYIEAYDLFLAKTFGTKRSYHSISEEVSIKDLNIITEKNYPELNYEMPSFSKLKTRLKQFNPLQRVEISETYYKPKITLDPEKGIVAISGASSPLSTTVYFDPIFEWLDLFDMSGKETLNVYFNFKYYNTYTSKFLVNFVWKCNKLSQKGRSVGFYWYYDPEDDEMREFGEYLQTQFNEGDKFHVLEKLLTDASL